MSPTWTPAEDALLRAARAEGQTYDQCAARVGRSRAACARRAQVLGCALDVARWTRAELALAVRLRQLGHGYRVVAEALVRHGHPRRDASQIVAKVRRVRPSDPRRSQPWTAPEVRRAAQLHAEGRTWGTVARALAAAGYPRRTRDGVRKAVRKYAPTTIDLKD